MARFGVFIDNRVRTGTSWRAALFLLISGGLVAAEPDVGETSGDPNIVVVMADDLGYADFGFQGCKDIPTSNMDQLAADGARFSQSYVTGCMCGPFRAGCITGRIQSTFGYYRNANQVLNPKQASCRYKDGRVLYAGSGLRDPHYKAR